MCVDLGLVSEYGSPVYCVNYFCFVTFTKGHIDSFKKWCMKNTEGHGIRLSNSWLDRY